MKSPVGIRCIKMATLYILVGLGIGIAMAASHDFSQKALHTHVNLAGWASLGLMGLIYLALPALTRSRLATAHFWLHNVGVPIMLVGVYFIHDGQMETGEPFAKMGSTITALGFLCFALNVWMNARVNEAA